MAQERLSVRSVREVLRLKHELGRSYREIASAVGVSVSTVSRYVRRATAAGISWPLPRELDAVALEAALFPAEAPSPGPRPEPDLEEYIHRELKRHKGTTPRLLWLWSTSRPTRADTGTASSVSSASGGGAGSTWWRARAAARVRRPSWTMPAPGSRSWTGIPARCARRWSSSVSWARRTTRSWT